MVLTTSELNVREKMIFQEFYSVPTQDVAVLHSDCLWEICIF